MFESRYSKVLTVILVIVIIAILGLLGYLGYDYFQKVKGDEEASSFVENFKGEIESDDKDEDTQDDEEENNENEDNIFGQIEETKKSTSSSSEKPTFKGFGVLGTMEIPAISFEYPVLEKVTTNSLDTSVVYLYGVGLNQVGNTVVIGHNYRNGRFFSNAKKLNNGDKIYVKDNDGKRLEYTIYNKFETTPEDTSFYQRDTDGKPELTLSTCTDDAQMRTIILARVE